MLILCVIFFISYSSCQATTVTFPTFWLPQKTDEINCAATVSQASILIARDLNNDPSTIRHIDELTRYLYGEDSATAPILNFLNMLSTHTPARLSSALSNGRNVINIFTHILRSPNFRELCRVSDAEIKLTKETKVISGILNLLYTILECNTIEPTIHTKECGQFNEFIFENICYPSKQSKLFKQPSNLSLLTFPSDYINNILNYQNEPVNTIVKRNRLNNNKLELVSNDYLVYLMLWISIQELYNYNCRITHPTIGHNFLLIHQFNFLYKDNATHPIARLFSENSCSYILSIRGTINRYEWYANFQSWSVPSASDPKTKVHYGFNTIALAILTPMIEQLELQQTQNCQTVNLVITGHSLGGALANILVLYLRRAFPKWNIKAITFAAPVALSNNESTKNSLQLINKNDALYDLPCSKVNSEFGMPRNSLRLNLPNGYGHDVFETSLNEIVFSNPENYSITTAIDYMFLSRNDADAFETAKQLEKQMYLKECIYNNRFTDYKDPRVNDCKIRELNNAKSTNEDKTILKQIVDLDIKSNHMDAFNCIFMVTCQANPKSKFNSACTLTNKHML